jgi:uroporphyrinogen decarboxylase
MWQGREYPCVLQGNIDSVVFLAGGKAVEDEAQAIYRDRKDRPFVFNLGHGVLPQTLFENIHRFLESTKEVKNS